MQSSDSGQHHNHDVHGAAADRDDGAAAVTRTSSRESGAGAARGMPPALQTELGQAAENAERYKPEESVDRDLEFQPRAMPPESLDKKGFFFYLSFLCYFIFITAGLWPFTDAKHQVSAGANISSCNVHEAASRPSRPLPSQAAAQHHEAYYL